MLSSFAAVFAKKYYIDIESKREKQEFFSKFDWTKPQDIKQEDITQNSP